MNFVVVFLLVYDMLCVVRVFHLVVAVVVGVTIHYFLIGFALSLRIIASHYLTDWANNR